MLRLTPEESSALLASVRGIDISPVDKEKFVAQLSDSSASSYVPLRIRDALRQFRQDGSPTGFLVIGIPNDSCNRTELVKIQAVLNQNVGEMVAYEAEGCGELFQDMVPSSTFAQTQTSLGSCVELEIHTEQAFSVLRPDTLSLACVRGDASAKTYVLHVRHILANLTPHELALLRRPLWTIGIDVSFNMSGTRGPIPILEGDENDPTLVFDQDLMRGLSEEADALRKKITEIYYEHRREHVLAAGEVLFIDNRRAVHGRSPFEARFDDTDRFVIRSFLVHDYSKSEHARRGRMVIASFS